MMLSLHLHFVASVRSCDLFRLRFSALEASAFFGAVSCLARLSRARCPKFTEPAYNRQNSVRCEHKRKELLHSASSIDPNGSRYSKAAVLASERELSPLEKKQSHFERRSHALIARRGLAAQQLEL